MKGRITDQAGQIFLRQRYSAAVLFKTLHFKQLDEDNNAETRSTNVIDNHTLTHLMENPEDLEKLKEELRKQPISDADWFDDDDTPVRIMHAVLVSAIPPPIYSVMFQLSLDFASLVDLLIWRAEDRDFWLEAITST